MRIGLAILCCLTIAPSAQAASSSASFELRTPAVDIEGGGSASASFQYESATGQSAPGQASSASFLARSGYLYYPIATASVITATAQDAEVDLTWTPSVGTWANIDEYQVGTSTSPGGPYTTDDVGNVNAYTKTGLANGTAYYFVVRGRAGEENLSVSPEVSAMPATPAGGGGGNSNSGLGIRPGATTQTGIVYEGIAYPHADVFLLRDGREVRVASADANGRFLISENGLSGGYYSFALYAKDRSGIRSILQTDSHYIALRSFLGVSGLILPPTIRSTYLRVTSGNRILFSGFSAPNAKVKITVHSSDPQIYLADALEDGSYLVSIATDGLSQGEHYANAQTVLDGQLSPLSETVSFAIDGTTVATPNAGACPLKADLNHDCRVDLTDFSIAAFWFEKELNPITAVLEGNLLNNDGVIDMTDFSIMAYYWTG